MSQRQKTSNRLKWCFLMNPAPLVIEFFGKLAKEIVESGDEYIVVANSKMAEYAKMKYFPKDAKFFSEVDWCINNYKKNQKEFQGLSWKEFFPEFDRFNRFKLYDFNYCNSAEIVAQSYQFADFIFQREKPDVIVAEPPTGIFNGLFYFLSKKYRKAYLGLLDSRIKDRFDIYDLEFTCSKYKETFRELKNDNISKKEKKFAQDFIRQFISHKQLPPYMDFQKEHLEKGEIGRIMGYLKREKEMVHHYFKYFSRRKYFKAYDYYSEFLINYIFRYPWKGLKSRFRILLQRNISDSLDNEYKFYLYPLQFEPEASTSVQAMYFCNQLNTIRNIAFSLPFPYKLYVKEHPSAVGTRTTDFYRRVKEIPNIVLISPYENVENLIKKSQGVIVLTTTIGIEAALIGKPVYVLGNVFYSYHPVCQKISNFDELKEKIQRDSMDKPTIQNLEDINIRFIVSYFINTIAGDIATACSKNDTNDYKSIYKEIKRIFLDNRYERGNLI